MRKRNRDEKRGATARMFDDRHARKQADRMENDGLDQDSNFNIWYGKRKKRRGSEKASTRCVPEVDAGVTRGSEAGALEFCIFFARGSCAKGYSCHKLHLIPTQEDDAAEDNMHDSFGRQRSGAEDDNDRDGVGCFLKENRTLWVGGIPIMDEASTREQLRQNFGTWGPIASIRLVKNKSCAFVQYAYRINAEFAKEAMSNQTLLTRQQIQAQVAASGEERRGKGSGPQRPPSSTSARGGSSGGDRVLGDDLGPVMHVRWAAEDPNPRAVLREREAYAQTLLAAQVATGALPQDVTGRLPGADRALLRKSGFQSVNPGQVDLEYQNTQRQYLALQGHGEHTVVYPNTDAQYPDTDHQYPNADVQYPSNGAAYPNTDHQYPDTDHQYQTNQYPNTDSQYPSAHHQHHHNSTGDLQYPTVDQQQSSWTDHQHQFGVMAAPPFHSQVWRSSDDSRSNSNIASGRDTRPMAMACPPRDKGDGTLSDATVRQEAVPNGSLEGAGVRGAGLKSLNSTAATPSTAVEASAGSGVGVKAGASVGPGVLGGSLSLLGGYGSGDDSD